MNQSKFFIPIVSDEPASWHDRIPTVIFLLCLKSIAA
jgi:hypothetical protein